MSNTNSNGVSQLSAACLTRNHLPTPAEVIYSRSLISNWEEELANLNHTINNLKPLVHPNPEVNDASKKTATTKVPEQPLNIGQDLPSGTEMTDALPSLLRKREILEKQLSTERAFVAPIRQLPIDIMTEILQQVVNGIPSRFLALVCKTWRYILQSTPSFWRTINLISIMCCSDPPSVLRRRLALAKSAELDVFLDGHLQRKEIQLRHILAASGVDRWRSLHLSEFLDSAGNDSIFKGNFIKLRSLTLSTYPGFPSSFSAWGSLLDLVAKTATSLRHFELSGDSPLPKSLTQTNVLSGLISLDIPFLSVDNPIPLDNLQELALGFYGGDPSITFPPVTSIKGCDFASIDKCNFRKVARLTIELNNTPKNQHPPFEMPQLVFLSIRGTDALTCLLDLHAPRLVELALLDTHIPYGKRTVPDYSKAATAVFGANSHQLHIKPTIVTLSLSLKVNAMLLILRSWDQIVHLGLYWNKNFPWSGHFLSAICQENTRPKHICPKLITLRIEMELWEDAGLTKWKEAAKKIIKARLKANLPLEKIVWIAALIWPHEVRTCTVKDVQ